MSDRDVRMLSVITLKAVTTVHASLDTVDLDSCAVCKIVCVNNNNANFNYH